jgi:hypothetical protein
MIGDEVDPQRVAEIRKQYCHVNGCTHEEFESDFAQAKAKKLELEELYGYESPIVDYGRWDRPKEKPRLTGQERMLLRRVINTFAPLEIRGRRFSTYGLAVRTMQSIPLDKRAPFFAEFESLLNLGEPDHVHAVKSDGAETA